MSYSLKCVRLLVISSFLIFPLTVFGQEEISDPLESINRPIFWFNDQVDVYVFEPVARRYKENIPSCVRGSVSSFFDNLKFPTKLLSSLMRGEASNALTHTGRFVLNSTVGIVGLIDVAEHVGLEAPDSDFGLAFAEYGIPAGPYLVIPFFGPSTLRDGIGRGIESAIDPISLVSYTNAISGSEATALNVGTSVLKGVQYRSELLDAVEAAKEASLDYYLFVQSAYYQYRAGLLRGQTSKTNLYQQAVSGEEEGELYFDKQD